MFTYWDSISSEISFTHQLTETIPRSRWVQFCSPVTWNTNTGIPVVAWPGSATNDLVLALRNSRLQSYPSVGQYQLWDDPALQPEASRHGSVYQYASTSPRTWLHSPVGGQLPRDTLDPSQVTHDVDPFTKRPASIWDTLDPVPSYVRKWPSPVVEQKQIWEYQPSATQCRTWLPQQEGQD